MRILLDECVDEALRHHFAGHECQTCRYVGFKGLTNGELLSAAEREGFDVLVTVDQNIPDQQKLNNRMISLVILKASTTNIDDLLPLIPDVLLKLQAIKPGEVVFIGSR